MPRHQTLRAVVDWSWDLLSDAERAVWRRFSVFTGGAGLTAAEQVCAGGPAPAADVLDLLTALVEKSLLTVRDGPDGPRYLMLEIIRAYGQERLAEAGEQDATRQAHAGYFRGLAAAARDELLAADQLTWLRRLAADQDNLHHRDPRRGGRRRRGHRRRAGRRPGLVLVAARAQGRGRRADRRRADAGRPRGDRADRGDLHHGRAADHGRRRQPAGGEQVPAGRGAGRAGQGPANPVLRLVVPLAEVVKIAVGMQVHTVPTGPLDGVAADPDPWMRSVARVIRGQLGLNFGHGHHEAEADFRAALTTFRELGERWGMAFSLISVATLAMWRGDFTAAVADMQESLALTSELGTTEDMVYFRLQLARCFWLIGTTTTWPGPR